MRDTFIEACLGDTSAGGGKSISLTGLNTALRDGMKEPDPCGDFDTGVACRIPGCKGTIIESVRRKYLGDPMHQIIGPGGGNQLTRIETHFCSTCKVLYAGLPEPQKKREPYPKSKD
jgi:hypothetical protein